ncbi:MAG: isopentenyl phosphate kinase family protein [Thaumarchaeota archaeon]|nr:isopentenyl phosphate kinase family protein [Nitrososphaerota archaeon]
MASKELILVKLGGSVITVKDKPLSFNQEATDRISRALASIETPLALVHGGGSFGHYYASKHKLSKQVSKASPRGISETKAAMIDLHSMVLKSLQNAGLSPFTVSPVAFTEAANKNWLKRHLTSLIRHTLAPVTYGDVLQDPEGYRIISGDTLMFELARKLNPRAAFFAMSEDGIYSDSSLSGVPIKEVAVNSSELDNVIDTLKASAFDATGGIVFKIQEARRIAELGVDVYFVNGFRPEQLVKVLKGGAIRGTLIKGARV